MTESLKTLKMAEVQKKHKKKNHSLYKIQEIE